MPREPKVSPRLHMHHVRREKLMEEAGRWLERLLRAATRVKKVRQQIQRIEGTIRKLESAELVEGTS